MTYAVAAVDTRVQDSAREWQKLQMGVLGFVGLCGVLQGGGGGESTRPHWVAELGGIAALAGLVVAILGVTIVASVAHPFSARPAAPAVAARRLRAGVVITFVAAAVTALAALTWWWPPAADGAAAEPPGQVTVTTASGAACGTVVGSGSGALQLDVAGKRVSVPFERLVSITPVRDC
jgi:hypothetical protein